MNYRNKIIEKLSYHQYEPISFLDFKNSQLSDKSICQLEKEEFNNWEIFNELNWPKIIIKEKIFEIEFKENILLLSADSLKYKSENIKKILEFIRLNQLGVSIN